MELTLSHIVLAVIVTAAAGLDLAHHKIPNWLTYSGVVLGLVLGALLGGGWSGLGNAGLGFLTGFGPMLLMYMGGGLGAGDVKLMGAVGALLGFPAALNALIASILVGGFCAALILLWQGRLFAILKNVVSRMWSVVNRAHIPEPLPEYNDSFPFGVAIALGTYLTMSSLLGGFDTPASLFG